MRDRLLTQKEFEKADKAAEWEHNYDYILMAQINKIDKWWIKKGDEIFQMEPVCWSPTQDGESICAMQCPISRCEYVQWQQLKKELGVSK